MHALERRQSPKGAAAKCGQRLNERSQFEGIVVGLGNICAARCKGVWHLYREKSDICGDA